MIVSDVPGSRFSTYWYRHPLMKNFSWGYLPISPTGFIFLLLSFLLLCRGGDLKIEVNKNI